MFNKILKINLTLFAIFIIILFSCPFIPDQSDKFGNPTKTVEEENFTITGLNATKLVYDNKIVLNWNPVSDIDQYNIYRYTSKVDTSPDIFSSITNQYDDTSTDIDQPYFYKVSCVKDSVEYDKCDYEFGVHSSAIDDYEDNDSLLDVQGSNTSPILNQDEEAMIYSCKDGSGDIVTDIDWYKYKGPTVQIFVEVESLSSVDFTNNDVKIRFYYDGEYKPEQDIVTGIKNTFSFYDNEATGDIEVFFKIYVDHGSVDKTKNIIGSYDIKLSDKF